MSTKEIKKTLIDKELSLTELAKTVGYSRAYISSVINGHKESKRAKKVIALALSKEFQELWGHDKEPAC